METSLNNFAPRVGAVYRFNDKTVFRDRLRPDLQRDSRGRARCAATTTIPSRSLATLPQRRISSRPTTRSQQGIPRIVGPDLSSGRVPLDRCGRRIHAGDRQHRSRRRAHLERRRRAASAVRHRGGRGVRRREGRRRIRRLGHQRPADAWRRRREPSVRIDMGRLIAHRLLGTAAGHAIRLAAGCAQQAVYARAAVQGRLHVEQGDERVRLRRQVDPELQHAERAVAQLGAGGVRPQAQL